MDGVPVAMIIQNWTKRCLPVRLFGEAFGWQDKDYQDYSLLSPTPRDGEPNPLPADDEGKDAGIYNGQWLQRVLQILVPSFLASRLLQKHRALPQRVGPTSWLDGLRGIAAMIVFVFHYTGAHMTDWTNFAYGDVDNNRPSSFMQLPFLRVLYSGRPMVAIFFVVSGYVLSYKSLKMARQRNYEKVCTTLSSSIFRRGLRLYMPPAAATFMFFIGVRLGFVPLGLRASATFWEEFVNWVNTMKGLMAIWNIVDVQYREYVPPLWTIPIEMAWSVILFVTVIGLVRCQPWIRMSTLLGIMYFCLRYALWPGIEFLGGAVIAEVALIDDENRAAAEQDSNATEKARLDKSGLASKTFWVAMLTLGLIICGWPEIHSEVTPVVHWFVELSPEPFRKAQGMHQSFVGFAYSALMIVFALQKLPMARRVFETKFAQYCGHISFSLYMMHNPLDMAMGHQILDVVWALAGCTYEESTNTQRFFVWLVGWCILAIPVIWLSDIFWRIVDQPSVSFARWLETKCLVSEKEVPVLPLSMMEIQGPRVDRHDE